jgi:hypothetical protein
VLLAWPRRLRSFGGCGEDLLHPGPWVSGFLQRLQDGAPKISFSWHISGSTMVYGRYNYRSL